MEIRGSEGWRTSFYLSGSCWLFRDGFTYFQSYTTMIPEHTSARDENPVSSQSGLQRNYPSSSIEGCPEKQVAHISAVDPRPVQGSM